jgi:hypothetical protein
VAKPTHAGESVIWKMTNGTVTFCTQVPVLETSAPHQKSEKLRCFSARIESRNPGLPFAGGEERDGDDIGAEASAVSGNGCVGR